MEISRLLEAKGEVRCCLSFLERIRMRAFFLQIISHQNENANMCITRRTRDKKQRQKFKKSKRKHGKQKIAKRKLKLEKLVKAPKKTMQWK